MWPWYLWSIYKRALIQYGIQDGWQRRKIVSVCFFFIHKYIFKIFMSEICFNCNECLFLIYNFEILLTVDSSMASKITAKMENSIYWWYFAVFFLKKSSHFYYFAFSTSLRMYHASELFIIKDVLDIYTLNKKNKCMLCTTCHEWKAADASWSEGYEVYGASTMYFCIIWLQAARGCL